MRQKTYEIRQFILRKCSHPSKNVAAETARHFGISRQAANRHLHALEKENKVSSEGKGRLKVSRLIPTISEIWKFDLNGLQEDIVWKEKLSPFLADLPENVYEIWNYGVTEMVNNAIDHSQGTELTIQFVRTEIDVKIWISDNGEGIFHRIQRLCNLYDAREAILELAKGKFTTDPANHSGEGIFFTSRVFDFFFIFSRNLCFSHILEQDDWLIDDDSDFLGTRVYLSVDNNSQRTLKSIFTEFSEPEEFTFSKTIVPVRLARHEGEKLVSRSQAKRLVSRFEKFKTVILDFAGVEEIGQAFSDEIFRVFVSAHPEVSLTPINVSSEVKKMIFRASTVK
uniref:Transcriptional regulator, ArsR family n=1 Tax=Candidatus Nitrotoga fabula TaxID=2182327 RepID=A0A2X0QTP5_9PROT|nr:Transcriptional regulator, ArsR family [Candidatus Nitrotoga fabula]